MTSLTVAIVGSGYMGGGIAQVLAIAGHDVRLADVTAEIAAANRERIIEEAEAFESAGLFRPGDAAAVRDRVTAATTLEEACSSADFIEEAVPERLELKLDILARISAAAKPSATIGSNTSTIAIADMAEAVVGPERFLGVHFSNPAPFIPGVEIIPHEGTAEASIGLAERIIAEAGKQPSRVTDVTGFVLNRLQYALFQEATRLAEEGVASVEAIDTIARTTFGFRLPFFGPFAIADMAGLDVYRYCYTSLEAAYPDRFAPPPVLDRLVADGALGVKSGRGFLATTAEESPALVEYRNRAYVELTRLLERLGPPPVRY